MMSTPPMSHVTEENIGGASSGATRAASLAMTAQAH